MKTLLVASLFILVLGNVYANDGLPANVLAEHATYVGFAPPEHRGTYKFQVLNDGTLQKIDNKNNITVVATLTTQVLEKLIKLIDAIANDDLIRPNTPPCMDAPTQEIVVQQSEGEDLKIWRRAGCRDYLPYDGNANVVSGVIKELYGAFSLLERAN